MSVEHTLASYCRGGNPWIIHGMKRSGNHALINWIQSGGRFFHINNALPVSYVLKDSNHFRFPVSLARVITRNRLRKIRTLGFWPATYLLSIEDLPISTQLFDTQCDVTNILLVRDPENLFASRIKKAFAKQRVAYSRNLDTTMQRAISVWLEHAEELLDTTEHLPNCIGVFFDKWASDPEYRKLIAVHLSISCSNAQINLRAKEGDGSSFGSPRTIDALEVCNLLQRRRFLNDRERALLDKVMVDSRVQETRRRLLTQFGMNAT